MHSPCFTLQGSLFPKYVYASGGKRKQGMSVVKNLSFKPIVKLQVLFPHTTKASQQRHENTSAMSQDVATTNLVSIQKKQKMCTHKEFLKYILR